MTDKGISEAASEKRKRGRPPIMNKDAAALVDWVAGNDVKTRRHKLNVYYRQRAVKVLVNDPRFTWVADEEKMTAGAAGAWKTGILSELGRIGNVEDMKAFAQVICELKPKTKEAILMIRRARLGRENKPDYSKLVNSLVRALDDYQAAHPDMPKDWPIRAFFDLAKIIQDRRGK